MASGPFGAPGQHVLLVATSIFQEKEVVLCHYMVDSIALEAGLRVPCAQFPHVQVMNINVDKQ